MRRTLLYSAASVAAVAATTWLLRAVGTANPTTIALTLLLVVLFVAAFADLPSAVVAALAAVMAFNFFFLPPVGALTLADPSNWIALAAFLIVGVVASHLSASARARAQDALERRMELTRLYDLTRDVLLTTESAGALDSIARSAARRFDLALVAICLPRPDGGWDIHQGAPAPVEVDVAGLDRAFASSAGAVEFDARTRTYGGHRTIESSSGPVTLSPIRIGVRATGLLATAAHGVEPGTRDAIAGIVAIALERSHFLEDRRMVELSRHRAELSSALLASLSHDLRTPLTAIRAAISNLEGGALDPTQQREQARLAAEQADRLTRLFEEILDMARIDAGAVRASPHWTTAAEIVEAALAHAAAALGDRRVDVEATDDVGIEVDPRLTSTAVAHLLENAARYSDPGATVHVKAWADADGLRLEVRDEGPGLEHAEIERLFEPFYRGEGTRNVVSGTGMGLSITRGLVNAQGGRVWAENLQPHGAVFSVAIPARTRAVAPSLS